MGAQLLCPRLCYSGWMPLIAAVANDENLGGQVATPRAGQRVQPDGVLASGASTGRHDERDPLKQGETLGKSADDRPGSSGEADRLSGLVVEGDRSDLGSIAFGLAADTGEGLNGVRPLVDEADLGTSDMVGVPHPNVEILAVTARSEQRHWFATAPSGYTHPPTLLIHSAILEVCRTVSRTTATRFVPTRPNDGYGRHTNAAEGRPVRGMA